MRFLYLVFALAFYSCTNSGNDAIRLAVSSNARFAFEELSEEFEKEEGLEIEIVSASSGKLSLQIMQGAPFDLFVSADTFYPNYIHRNSKSIDGVSIYGIGTLVLWGHDENVNFNLDYLRNDGFDKISIANPENAPYGKAAKEALINSNSWEALEHKFIYGENISQTTQYVVQKAAEIGFTAKSMVMSPKLRNTGYWVEIDSELYNPILQGMVLLSQDPGAKEFRDFVLSPKGKAVLSKYGYKNP